MLGLMALGWMAATTTNVVSWETFEQLPNGDGFLRELVEGELQILPPPMPGHSKPASLGHSKPVTLGHSKRAQVHLPKATMRRLGISDALSLPELLPLPIARIFED